MTTKHTPGPWFAEAVDGRWCVWDAEGMACICDVHAGVEPDPSGAHNARLIAAAPDLLAACEAWLSGETTWSTTQAYEMAARAVAKAKGET